MRESVREHRCEGRSGAPNKRILLDGRNEMLSMGGGEIVLLTGAGMRLRDRARLSWI